MYFRSEQDEKTSVNRCAKKQEVVKNTIAKITKANCIL